MYEVKNKLNNRTYASMHHCNLVNLREREWERAHGDGNEICQLLIMYFVFVTFLLNYFNVASSAYNYDKMRIKQRLKRDIIYKYYEHQSNYMKFDYQQSV